MSEAASAPSSGGSQRLLADVDRQPEVGLLGSGDQLGSLGGGDADGDGLARVFGSGSSGATLRGFGHGSRIGDTKTLDKGELSCHGNPMTTTRSIRVPATDVQAGDNYYLTCDMGVRVARTERTAKTVRIYTEAGLLATVKAAAEVRLHGRGIPA